MCFFIIFSCVYNKRKFYIWLLLFFGWITNEFDQYLDKCYLSKKARKDRWYWNRTTQDKRTIALKENRQWKPGVAYCRYADDFVLIVKGNKQQAEAIRDQCRNFLEGKLKLTLNMEKTHITHVNDGFIFLGHRIIRKRGPKGNMRVVSGIPHGKAKAFSQSLSQALSSDHSCSKIDKVEQLAASLKAGRNFIVILIIPLKFTVKLIV